MAKPNWLQVMEVFYRARAVLWARTAPIKRIHTALGRFLAEATPAGVRLPRRSRLRRRAPTKRSAAVKPMARIPRRANRQLSPEECKEVRATLGSKRGTHEYAATRDAFCLRLGATRRQVGSVFATPKAAAARVRMQQGARRASAAAAKERNSGGRSRRKGRAKRRG